MLLSSFFARRDDGASVASETIVGKDGVDSYVSITATDGTTQRWSNKGDLAEFLKKRGELFADTSEGVTFGKLRLSYEASYTSAVVLSSGQDVRGEERHVLSSLGVHAAFPFPGQHWDEGQIAVLGPNFQPIVTLRMPKVSEAAHLDVRFEDATDVRTRTPQKVVTFQGWMEDDAGKLHFVEAKYVLGKQDIERTDPTIWDRITDAIDRSIGFEQNAKLLRELDVPVSTLMIDHVEVLKIEETLGAIDDGARFNLLPNSSLTAINYAPPSSPLISTIDPREGEARYRFDASLLQDEKGWISKLLRRVARGSMSAHYVAGEDGKRRDVSEEMTPDRVLSTKQYTWKWKDEPIATMTRELVIFRDSTGNAELGFRETIRKID